MTTHDRIYRRVLRRETHSSKAGLAITLGVILIITFVYIGAECVLALMQSPPLLVAPKSAALAVIALPRSVSTVALIVIGAAVAVVGLIILIAALTPGRRLDHVGRPGRTAVAIDNRAIASAIARSASRAAGVDPDRVVVTVGRRRAVVRIQPTSGWPVDVAAVDEAVASEIERMNVSPALRQSLEIAKTGLVGA